MIASAMPLYPNIWGQGVHSSDDSIDFCPLPPIITGSDGGPVYIFQN